MTPTYNRGRREKGLRNIAPSREAAIEGGFLRYNGSPHWLRVSAPCAAAC